MTKSEMEQPKNNFDFHFSEIYDFLKIFNFRTGSKLFVEDFLRKYGGDLSSLGQIKGSDGERLFSDLDYNQTLPNGKLILRAKGWRLQKAADYLSKYL